MIVTASKNAGADIVQKAKLLVRALPGAQFLPRSKRSLGAIAKIAQKRGEKSFLALSKSGDAHFIRKFAATPHGWNWDEDFLEIRKIKAGPRRPVYDCAFGAKSAEAKKLCAGFGFQDAVWGGLGADLEKISVSALKGVAKFSSGKKIIAQIGYAWGKK